MTNPSEQAEIRRRAQDAKEYLIAQIVQEAQQENVPLSDVERKMLYFTESVETIPDIYEVNDQFELDYEDAEYEAKIAALLKHARKRVAKDSPDGAQRWWQAERDLRKEDHYLGVMVGQSHERELIGSFWTVIKWAGITMAVLPLGFYLYMKGAVPKWIENLPRWTWFFVILMALSVANFVERLTFEDVKSFFRKRSRE
jgi:hypothetical protein